MVVLATTVLVWRKLNPPVNPLNGDRTTAQSIGDFDQFQRDLAARVGEKLGGGEDFTTIVAVADYPLGTLLRPAASIPANMNDCAPPSPPPPVPAPRLFPSYTMSSGTALTADFGSNVLDGLTSAGVNLGQSQNVEYAIAETQIQIMDDNSVQQVMSQGGCGTYISQNPGVRLIRGAVTGKMTFTVKVSNPASVKAQLAKIGFSVTDNPQTSTLSIADQQSQPIVQLLSEFRASPGVTPGKSVAETPPEPQPVKPARPSVQPPPPISTTRGPHIYVQADASEDRAKGANVVRLLRDKWPSANIEREVERIPTKRMPQIAQVRYFNESDAEAANRCVTILSDLYPNVRAVRIGLPSPSGQLEVWLPRKSN